MFFSPNTFLKKWWSNFKLFLKKSKCNSFEEPDIYPNLDDQQFRRNKTNGVKDYFISEIKERELMSRKLRLNCIFWLFW